jgi:hypothetical protein
MLAQNVVPVVVPSECPCLLRKVVVPFRIRVRIVYRNVHRHIRHLHDCGSDVVYAWVVDVADLRVGGW